MLRRLACALLTLLACACASAAGPEHAAGRLAARPHAPSLPCTAGLHPLGVDPDRDALLYVPASAVGGARGAPLLVYLHGATGKAARGIDRLRDAADARGVILLAPQSADITWDAIRGSLGTDVARVDRALALAFDRCSVDPARVFVSGFSDGASYALTLGLANGDLFSRIVAFSPGFVPGRFAPAGMPRIFVSHGRADEILPIDRSGRPIARNLTRAGYDVRYEEFDGRHEVPPRVRDAALDWLLAP